MNIKNLWKGYKFPMCENCKRDCKGQLDYSNLCANLNYLKNYAEANYEKNRESFITLKSVLKEKSPFIFSFGCGLGLDYIGAKEILGDDIKYFGIDECDWAIKQTQNYKNFEPKLPTTIKYDNGIFLLNAVRENVVICFFNSLFTISNNVNVKKDLLKALQNKNNFYIVCDFTINNTYHMPQQEMNFLREIENALHGQFRFKHLKILEEKGIIIYGEHR